MVHPIQTRVGNQLQWLEVSGAKLADDRFTDTRTDKCSGMHAEAWADTCAETCADTGADICVMSREKARKLSLELGKTDMRIRPYGSCGS